jgi:hypothetical protein
MGSPLFIGTGISYDSRVNIHEIDQRVESALLGFWAQDSMLLEYGVHEQTIAGSLMCHLRYGFPEFHVDVEYNRRSNQNRPSSDPKRVDSANLGGPRPSGLIKPDIIVHRRGSNWENIAAFEIKSLSGRSLWRAANVVPAPQDPQKWVNDRMKLSELKRVFSYQRTYFLVFPTGPDFARNLLKMEPL